MHPRTSLALSLLLLSGGGLCAAGLMQPALVSAGPIRTLPVTGTGGSDYTITIGNRYSTASVTAFSRQLIELTNGDPLTRLRSFRVAFASNTAAAVVPFRIWLAEKSTSATVDYEFQLLGTGSFTARASGAGIATTSIITSSEYVADVVSFTPATTGTAPIGIYNNLSALYGTTYTAFSPGSLVPAALFISDAGNYRYVVFDFDPGNTVTAVAIVTPGT